MNNRRQIRTEEKILIEFLLTKIPASPTYIIPEEVEEYGAFGMGSINLNNPNTDLYDSDLIQAEYTDADKIPVVISLTKDQHNQLLDLDFWKSDFSRLVVYPKPADLLFAE
ncbi:DUF6984 family protein [Cytophaga hutchinsonii]|jgi:hypothetical protein|uniref:DUF6984 family protein n=1 Tax=Cytophaga hutchinsonii TaxID=985 RepID=UPI000038F323|nr:hypothetical protein [Cytophaga hutchinsonii]SFX12693.1 hypothetical protein SAMN04487930_101615 [Cytophaga hutchinsonii ATCC 33406]